MDIQDEETRLALAVERIAKYEQDGVFAVPPAAAVWKFGYLWEPHKAERRECCRGVLPRNMWQHCLSIRHVAHVFDVSEHKLRAQLRIQRAVDILTVGSK